MNKTTLLQGAAFLSMYIGYAFYILNRKSFTYVLPQMVEAGEITAIEAGKVLSSFSFAYTAGKFVSGVFVDQFSPTMMFTFGLCTCGLINVLFSYASVDCFIVLWFLNGLCQGPGWPACAKLLKNWYPPKQFGTMWSILSTCMNVAAAVGPLISSWCMQGKPSSEWRTLMLLFGTGGLFFSALAYFTMEDKFETKHTLVDTLMPECGKPVPKKKHVDSVWGAVLGSPYSYVLAFSYMACIFTKNAMSDWGTTYLIEDKQATAASSNNFLPLLEIGGLCGRVLSGITGDALVSYFGRKSHGHPRHILLISLQFMLMVALYFVRVYIISVSEQWAIASVFLFFVGFSVYGSITTIGMMSMENCPTEIAGTSHAFCGLLGNFGLVLSGYPLSYFATLYSWNTGFQIAEYVAAFSLCSFVVFQWKNCYIGPRPKTL